ncbi:hypothetical protein AUJ66_03740 [Candidatus Desantisbacteria bacterium CG1_02_38_46]|uniref:HEPN domain-containing protein n=3 Tax=unclassified Candidatus Desantisiibacteriota TaxID=3106372 RepID=A0A2H9PEF3_9BACT|nr:MAG: hypothetical protein AUJ66_03740 [Candidatus Desantisbacteria bacterium CG1_02_38_46]PIU51414.1 MAG: hypothetical protein COS91_04590 [Candidatus Desantisbacteria bacterium CG07_land_8_20_14_0_80_39_15]PIZ17404.1 MAG: hypothetical protein COY51_00225 [Candidatus Desantisbacteria bacterium CG_4_10_14_0_8_um_filter_39_17]
MEKYNIQEAIEKRRIIPFSDGPKISFKELMTAKEDLRDAKETLARKRFKWATSQAYYAIFHASRALLYKKKYREKSHIQLVFAIKAFYVDKGLLPQGYYDNFIQALDLREMADYKSKFSKQGAQKSIQAAEEAIKLVENLLKNKKF